MKSILKNLLIAVLFVLIVLGGCFFWNFQESGLNVISIM